MHPAAEGGSSFCAIESRGYACSGYSSRRIFVYMDFSSGIVDRLDPLRLRLLVEVERRGSISAAAAACRVGQPSATKHLKTLETAVGERLVERDGRSSRLTEAGGIVAEHAVR